MLNVFVCCKIQGVDIDVLSILYSDYGFQRKNFDEECTPINTDDLDNELIPDNCPEGTNYSRSQGYEIHVN